MSKTIINATDVRNDFFKLIDKVARTKDPIFIKKDKEVKVKIEPVGTELNEDWEETKRRERMKGRDCIVCSQNAHDGVSHPRFRRHTATDRKEK